MHKYELLRFRAEQYRMALEEYAQEDQDVADFLERWMPWYERVQNRQIRLPCHEYKLFTFFTNPDLSPLAERYGNLSSHPLTRGDSLFFQAIRDLTSDPNYLARLRSAGEEPDLIPDEPAPPEEETPLPEPPKPIEPCGLRGIIRRWLGRS